jgi:tetratricopeptide (TPR) repeat protein
VRRKFGGFREAVLYFLLNSMALSMDIDQTYQRGFSLRCEGRYDEAKAEFKRVLALDPAHCDSQWQMGLIQGFEGDFDASLATLHGLVVQYPGNLNVRYDYAMTLMMLGDFDQACTELKFILAKDPTHEKALQQATYCP